MKCLGPSCIVMIAAFGAVGCSSMSSTYLGNPSEGQQVTGMPVVLERPRYLRVTVKEIDRQLVTVRVGQRRPNSDTGVSNPGPPPLPGTQPAGGTPTSGAITSAEVHQVVVGEITTGTVIEYENISVGEVYALDFKRPAAGTAEFEVDFADSKQYPSKIKAKSEDKTIEEIRETLGTVLEAIADGATPTSGTLGDDVFDSGMVAQSVEVATRVLKVYIYDLDQLGSNNYKPVQIYP